MNKRILLLIVYSIIAVVAVTAKEPENWSLFKTANVVNYEFDFSTFKIDKVDAKDYIEMTQKISYEKYKNSTANILAQLANEQLNKLDLKISNDTISDFLLKVKPLTADDDGEHTFLFALYYKPDHTLIEGFEINSNGGDGDSFVEEFLDGLKKTGRKLGKKIANIKETVISLK